MRYGYKRCAGALVSGRQGDRTNVLVNIRLVYVSRSRGAVQGDFLSQWEVSRWYVANDQWTEEA